MKFLFFCFFLSTTYAQQVTLQTIRDLNFGTLVQGDPNKNIRPNNSDPDCAILRLEGPKGLAYTISIPSTINLYNENPGALPLEVDKIRTRPSAGNEKTIPNKGFKEIFLGGRLRRIPKNQIPGSYEGNIMVEVIY